MTWDPVRIPVQEAVGEVTASIWIKNYLNGTGASSCEGYRKSRLSMHFNACQGGKMNFLLFFGALCAVRTGAEAFSKGRSGHGNGWFALGLLLNILALVLIAYLP